MALKGQISVDEVNLLEVTADPSVSGSGVFAPIGSIALLNDGVNRGAWQKFGLNDIDWVSFVSPTVGGSGVVPPFTFSKAGNAGPGTYLRTGEAVTSNTGQPIKGTNVIVEIAASNGSNVGSITRIQIQRRTAVNTFVDIAGAFVDIPSGQFKAKNSSLSIAWGPDWEMSAYVKSGSSLDNPILVVYLNPV